MEKNDVYSSEKPEDKNRLKKTVEKIDFHWEKGVPGKFDVYPMSKKVLRKIKERAPKRKPVLENPSFLLKILHRMKTVILSFKVIKSLLSKIGIKIQIEANNTCYWQR